MARYPTVAQKDSVSGTMALTMVNSRKKSDRHERALETLAKSRLLLKAPTMVFNVSVNGIPVDLCEKS